MMALQDVHYQDMMVRLHNTGHKAKLNYSLSYNWTELCKQSLREEHNNI